jgi:hypothetical protein
MSRANPRTTHNNAGIAAWRFKLRGEVRSYEEAERFLKESPEWANGEPAAELGPHMTVQMHDTEPSDAVGADCYAVKLYNTEIIRYFPDGTFSVDNGGHNTPTTRERLQAVVPDGFLVYHHQKRLGLRYLPDSRIDNLWPLDHSKRILPTTITVVDA